MSGIQDAKQKIKKKMTLGDYEKSETRQNKAKEIPLPKDKKTPTVTQKQELEAKKIRSTIYFSETDNELINEIYIQRMREGRKVNRSDIISEAIQYFFQKECKGNVKTS